MYITLNENKRIVNIMYYNHDLPEEAIEITELPEDFIEEQMLFWIYDEGVFTYSPYELEEIQNSVITIDDILEMVADQEYRLCLLELGKAEEEFE